MMVWALSRIPQDAPRMVVGVARRAVNSHVTLAARTQQTVLVAALRQGPASRDELLYCLPDRRVLVEFPAHGTPTSGTTAPRGLRFEHVRLQAVQSPPEWGACAGMPRSTASTAR